MSGMNTPRLSAALQSETLSAISTHAITVSGRDEQGRVRRLVIAWDGTIMTDGVVDEVRGRHDEIDAWSAWARKVAGHHANNFPNTWQGLRDAVDAAIVALRLDVDCLKTCAFNNDEAAKSAVRDAENFKAMCRDKDERIRDLTACLHRVTQERDDAEQKLLNLRLAVRAAASDPA